MLVVVVVDKAPFLDRVETGLDQRHVRKCLAVEGVDERFRIIVACHGVEKSTIDQNVPRDIRSGVGKVGKGRVGTQRLTREEGGGHAATLRWRRSCQHLCRKGEESIEIADGGREHAEAPEYGGRIFGSLGGVK